MEKVARYTLLVIAFMAFWGNAKAQDAFSMSTTYMQDGAPKTAVKSGHYSDIEGSPYLYDGWGAGEARLADGKAYKNLFLQYDEIQGTVSFKYALTDSAQAFAVPATEFAFSYITNGKVNIVHFLNGFESIGDANKSTYYQVLAMGKTQLLKRTVKKISKQQEYGSAQTKQIVTETTNYYLAGEDKKPIKIKNDNKAVLEALSNKADKVKQYIKDNNLNAKNDDDFTKIIAYCNTI
jgi:hypothetical protein